MKNVRKSSQALSGNGDNGIEGSSSNLIIHKKNIITKNDGAGIDLSASDATIEGNEIRKNGGGIGLDNNSGGVVKGNIITQPVTYVLGRYNDI